MRALTEDVRLELTATMSILKKIRLLMDVHRRQFDEVMAALVYLDDAEFEYNDEDLRLGSLSVTDTCTARDCLRQDRAKELKHAHFLLSYHWDCIEAAAERFNPQIDRPLKQIYAETGNRQPRIAALTTQQAEGANSP